MPTTKDDIRNWLERAKEEDKRWVLVVCDTFSHEDYPVATSDIEKFFKEYDSCLRGENMKRLMEVYDTEMDFEDQLSQHRCMSIPDRPKDPAASA